MDYVAVGTIHHGIPGDGKKPAEQKIFAPGEVVDIPDKVEMKRLLELGAIKPREAPREVEGESETDEEDKKAKKGK